MKQTTREIVARAWKTGIVIPAFNIPYLPMMKPVVRALRDTNTVGLIQVARPEWIKFEAGGMRAVRQEYERVKDERYTRLHLDHVPVIDEDGLRVDYKPIFREAIELGYESVMIDGSRLPLEENIAATARVANIAHDAGVPVEGELGAVMGHEPGPLPPYDELFESGRGFTDSDEARSFVEETGVDWLSVAVGNIHGALSGAAAKRNKVQARLNLEHLECLREATSVPLVLHGGSGIRRKYILEGIKRGIAKINIGTTIRKPYQSTCEDSIAAAQEKVYEVTVRIVTDELEAAGSADNIGDSRR